MRNTRERARRAGNRDVDEDGMSGEKFLPHKGASRETAMILDLISEISFHYIKFEN
jgi:hypothetical protein